MDVVARLRGLGLEQYAPGFRDNDIDGDLLRRLTAEDLRELGVASLGHHLWPLHFDLFCLRVAVGERTESDVDVQSRHNGRRDGLRHGSHRVSDIYPDRDLSCSGKSGGVCRHGCRQREYP